MRTIKINSLPFILVLFGALFAMSCAPTTASYKFSNVFEGGFDPVAEFRRQGYTVQNETRGEKIKNAVVGYAWQSWCGVLQTPPDRKGGEAVAKVIRDSLNLVLGGNALDELTMRNQTSGQPLTGMLRYNQGQMHGDLYVWLIPDASEATVNYVIFLREERQR